MRLLSLVIAIVLTLVLAPVCLAQETIPSVPGLRDQQRTQTSYMPNQVIVKYRSGASPMELLQTVTQRQDERKSLLGMIKLFIADIQLQFQKQDTPEVKLLRLQQAEQAVGVTVHEDLFKSQDPTLKNFYILKLSGIMEVPQAVSLLKSLPEVETAEPNYIATIQGGL